MSLDDKRERVAENDIPDVIKRWKAKDPKNDTDRTAKAFFVPVEEVIGNKYDLAINRYKQIAPGKVEYEPPSQILGRLREMEREVLADLDSLERMLG